MYIYTHVYMCVYICIYIYIYMHTHAVLGAAGLGLRDRDDGVLRRGALQGRLVGYVASCYGRV